MAFSVCLAHQEDFGGKVPGSMPTDSTEIYQEGLIVPPLKLYDAGRPDATLFKMIERNVRLPRQVLGDIGAQVSAVTVGCARIIDLCRSEGTEKVLAYMDHLLDYAERRTRARIAEIPDGVYSLHRLHGQRWHRPRPPRAHQHYDYNPRQRRGRRLCRHEPTGAGADQRASFGRACLCLFRFSLRDGSHHSEQPRLLSPDPGRRTKGMSSQSGAWGPVAIRAHTLKRAADAVLGALVQAVPGRVPAAPAGSISCVSFGGTREDGTRYGLSDLIAGGGGARPDLDGIEAHRHRCFQLHERAGGGYRDELSAARSALPAAPRWRRAGAHARRHGHRSSTDGHSRRDRGLLSLRAALHAAVGPVRRPCRRSPGRHSCCAPTDASRACLRRRGCY